MRGSTLACLVCAASGAWSAGARADGLEPSAAIEGSVAVGPVPSDFSFERLDVTGGVTAWGRVHVGAGVGLGTGGQANWLAEAFGEVDLVLHTSSRVDLWLGWRLGGSWFSVDGSRIPATMGASMIAVRLRVRPHLDAVVQPIVLTGYYSGLWAVLVGPSVGVSVPW